MLRLHPKTAIFAFHSVRKELEYQDVPKIVLWRPKRRKYQYMQKAFSGSATIQLVCLKVKGNYNTKNIEMMKLLMLMRRRQLNIQMFWMKEWVGCVYSWLGILPIVVPLLARKNAKYVFSISTALCRRCTSSLFTHYFY